MDKALGTAGIGKRTAYVFQAAFLLLGLALQNFTYADRDIALLACSTGLIVQILTILWFCKTRRGYIGKKLLTGSAVLSLAVILGTFLIYERRAVPHARVSSTVILESVE